MNADGSNQTNLTGEYLNGYAPNFSPDMSKIIFASSTLDGQWQIYVMNADGSGLANLSNNNYGNQYASFSPDGSKIAFMSTRPDVINNLCDRDVTYRCDSQRHQIYVMNSDGSGPINLSNNVYYHSKPSWSPDGNKIIFTQSVEVPERKYWLPGEQPKVVGVNGIFTMNSDGTNQTGIATATWPGDALGDEDLYIYGQQRKDHPDWGH
jgi:TolB protein